MVATCKARAALLLAAAFFYFPFGVAQAQVPSTAEPGIITRSLEKEKKEPSRAGEVIVIEKEQAEGKGGTEKVFTLRGVVLEGSTIYGPENVNQLAQGYLGKSVSFADLNAISQMLTKEYRDDGYIFSRAIVPPQKVKDGIVHLKVIEGRVTDVTVVGNFKDDNGLIKNMAEKIRSAGPSNEKDIERYLLLIDDLPGITARGVLRPSKTPGGGELVITIEEDSFEGSLSIDNRGSRFLGPYRGTAVVAVNSIFGIHDRTTVRGIASSDFSELLFGDITHEEQLGTEGLRLKLRYAKTRTRPGDNLSSLNIKGDSDLFDVEALYPLLRSRRLNLNIITGFDGLNSESDVLGIQVSNDRVRSLRGGGHFDFTDSWAGINQIELQLTKGIAAFDATSDGLGRSRANGKHDFLRTNVSATRIQDLWDGISAQVSVAGQYSADPLLASEEFNVGGPDFGRAYDVGEITGDSGIAGAFELRYTGPPIIDFIKSYQVYGYYDGGKVWNEKVVVGEVKTDDLTSAGAGVRFNLDYDFSGYLEVNKPITRNVSAEGDRDPRVFFTLLKRF